MKRLFSALLALGVLCLAANSGLAQTCEAGRNDSSKPEVYIVFEKLEDAASRNQTVWLRLYNNSKCRMMVRLDQQRESLKLARDKDGNFLRSSNGGLQLFHDRTISHGGPEPVVYGLLNRKTFRSYIGNLNGDVIISLPMDPETSTIFPVRPRDIRRDWALSLDLIYEGGAFARDEFKIYFDFNHLPAEAFPRKR